jgi:hypothetical protein
MTTTVLAPAASQPLAAPYTKPDDIHDKHLYYTGRADAYDEHADLTVDELSVRAAYITDLHPSLAYALGYTAYVKGVQLEQQLTSGRTTEER